MAKTGGLAWSSSSFTHQGTVRKVNEDAKLECPRLGRGGLWAVADGMGGHAAGEVASGMVVDALRQLQPAASLEQFADDAEVALQTANRTIMDKAASDYQNRVIGSTVVILLLYQEQAACLWVGDSRIYRLRDGQLALVTRDHSHVQELLDRGLISAEEADNHPLSNVITRAVGSSEELSIDSVSFSIQPNDVFLLCSDGLNKVVGEDEIATILRDTGPQHAVNSLVNSALRRHADDNVTTAVVAIRQEEVDTGGDTVPLQT